METNPKVSIIIPTYNRENLLKKAIESVFNQTFTDYEIIVSDDGSTDNTKEMMDSFESDKIVYMYQENRGRSSARNRALNKAKGKYIAFLDSDDIFLPEKLEIQVKALDENPDFGMVYSSALVIDGNGKYIERVDSNGVKKPITYQANDSGWLYDKVALYTPLTITLPTVVVRSEVIKVIGGFDEKMNRFEDTDMWRRIAMKYQLLAVPKPLCLIRTHKENSIEKTGDVYYAINYYISKVMKEDSTLDKVALMERVSWLYWTYAAVILVKFNPVGFKFVLKPFKIFPGYRNFLLGNLATFMGGKFLNRYFKSVIPFLIKQIGIFRRKVKK